MRSHLLRHKIYRTERERLLSSITQLDLFEPHHVPLPNPTSPPIEALPIISGYRCTALGCETLCASSKRMRRHRREVHNLSEPPNSSSFARPVKLQTFFRGTKLKYFEVDATRVAGTTRVVSPATTTTDNGSERYGEGGHDEQSLDALSTTSPTPPSLPLRVPKPPENLPGSSLVNIDLRALTYFHHFTTATSRTLPINEYPLPAAHYWQTDVVLLALRWRWLMCGLLAISACHLATLADGATIEWAHREQSAQFFAEFSAGWEETARHDMSIEAAGVEEEVKKAGGRIRCILVCAHWPSSNTTLNQGINPGQAAISRLQTIMTTLRSFAIPDFKLCPGGTRSDDDDGQEEVFARASRILKTRGSSGAGSFGVFSSFDGSPSALFNRLSALPSRMAEAIGKPESAQDVLATLSAMATLVECCDITFESDEMGAAWRGTTTWLIKVPDHFNHMVSRHNPAALVVLAHWAASLVIRAENCGCWFLKGSAQTVLLEIAEQIPADDRAVQSLVGSLMA